MLQKYPTLLLFFGVFLSLSPNSQAEVKKTKTASTPSETQKTEQKLPEPCKKMFSIADKLVIDADRQPGTHTQVAKMKNKLSVTKKEILKMETTMQEKSCNKGLTVLNTLKQQH